MNYKEFYDNHIKLLAEGNVDKLVENDYHENAEMVILVSENPVYVKGKEEIKKLFNVYLKDTYRGFVSTEKFGTTEDSICFEATINTAAGNQKVWDGLFMKDGKIFRHYSGLK